MRRTLAWEKIGNCIKLTSHGLDNNGYARMQHNGKWIRIGRVIVTRRHGQLPPEVMTRHTCDNKWCINPSHLLIGSAADNARDRMTRGRNRKQDGEKGSAAKLTESQVRLVLRSSEVGAELARKMGVNYRTISAIRNGKTWKHLGVN